MAQMNVRAKQKQAYGCREQGYGYQEGKWGVGGIGRLGLTYVYS